MSVTHLFRNCGADCAEHNGGHCPGETCAYRPTVIVDEEWLATWTSNSADLEADAYDRGLRDGHRNARVQYGRGRFVGFVQGVTAVFGCWLVLVLIERVAS